MCRPVRRDSTVQLRPNSRCARVRIYMPTSPFRPLSVSRRGRYAIACLWLHDSRGTKTYRESVGERLRTAMQWLSLIHI